MSCPKLSRNVASDKFIHYLLYHISLIKLLCFFAKKIKNTISPSPTEVKDEVLRRRRKFLKKRQSSFYFSSMDDDLDVLRFLICANQEVPKNPSLLLLTY